MNVPAIVTGDLMTSPGPPPPRPFSNACRACWTRGGRAGVLQHLPHAGTSIIALATLTHLFSRCRVFRLNPQSRLPKHGSTTFPILFSLALTECSGAIPTPEQSDAEERAEVREMATRSARRTAKQSATDWKKYPGPVPTFGHTAPCVPTLKYIVVSRYFTTCRI